MKTNSNISCPSCVSEHPLPLSRKHHEELGCRAGFDEPSIEYALDILEGYNEDSNGGFYNKFEETDRAHQAELEAMHFINRELINIVRRIQTNPK